MIPIKELAKKLLEGQNGKYIVFLGVGIMLLIASSLSFGDGGMGGDGALEKRMAHILGQIQGVGEVEVLIHMKGGAAEGVIVVAQGAENSSVKKTISDAVVAALGVSPHKVEVLPLRGAPGKR